MADEELFGFNRNLAKFDRIYFWNQLELVQAERTL